jgi:cell shape-determining protein MreC
LEEQAALRSQLQSASELDRFTAEIRELREELARLESRNASLTKLIAVPVSSTDPTI